MAVHTDFQTIFVAKPLKAFSRHVTHPQTGPDPGAQLGQMISQQRNSGRVVSEKRRAAARANGAKSQGPVTGRGKANSSRNSRRHGLRARVFFTDPASLADLAVELAAFERDFKSRSGIERKLVGMMAVASWRQTCLRKLETAMLNGEVRRLKSLKVDEKQADDTLPEDDPLTLLARAFRSLVDHTCFPRISRLECRFESIIPHRSPNFD